MDSVLKTFFTANIKANFPYIRKELGLTQHQFADKLGVPQKNLAAMEEGRSMSIEIIYRVSRFMGVSMDTVLTTNLSK